MAVSPSIALGMLTVILVERNFMHRRILSLRPDLESSHKLPPPHTRSVRRAAASSKSPFSLAIGTVKNVRREASRPRPRHPMGRQTDTPNFLARSLNERALCPLPSELGNFCPRQLAQWRSSQYLPSARALANPTHSFCDQRLSTGQTSDHLKYQFTRWQRGIDPSVTETKLDSEGTAHLGPGLSCFSERANLSNFQTRRCKRSRRQALTIRSEQAVRTGPEIHGPVDLCNFNGDAGRFSQPLALCSVFCSPELTLV